MTHPHTFSRRTALAAPILAAPLLALAGCGTGAPAADDSTLTLGVSGKPPSLDPALQGSAGDLIWRWHAVYDTLLRCDADGNIIPAAAESHELSEDATTLTMTLREGMTFSDGSPVDAAAVKASIEHMQTGGGSDAGRVADMTVEATDERTVVLTAPEPTGQLPTFMCFSPGIVASPAQLESPEVGTEVISSGPYELDTARTTSGSVYTYTKRADYWDAETYPYENLVIKIMPDVNARLNALRNNEIQCANISQETATEAESTGLHVTEQLTGWNGLNIADRTGETVPALGDVRVRRAINIVFDRPAIAKSLFAGDATATTQIFTPNETAYIDELTERYPFDVDGAKALMAEAGYENGFSVQLPNQASDDGSSSKVNPLVVQQLTLLNIDVEEVTISGPTATDRILGGEFAIFPASLGTGDSLFDIVQSLEPGSIWNVQHTSDPDLQPLLDEAQILQDEEAEENYRKINEYIVEQAWFAPWVNYSSYVAMTSQDLAPESTDQFHMIPNLWDFR